MKFIIAYYYVSTVGVVSVAMVKHCSEKLLCYDGERRAVYIVFFFGIFPILWSAHGVFILLSGLVLLFCLRSLYLSSLLFIHTIHLINRVVYMMKYIYVYKYIYPSKKTESQVDMKEAKRMTLFNIMINVSRNGIKAIMKNDPIKYLQKTRQKCGLQSPPTAKSYIYINVFQH